MTRSLFALCLAVFVLAGCESTPKVSTDFDPSYDFAGKTRIAVLRPEEALRALGRSAQVPAMNSLRARRFEQAIAAALEARGYRVVPAAEAQLVATFMVTTANRTQVTSYNTGFGYRRCWSYSCAALASPQVDVKNYTEGTLLVDMIDVARTELVWRGVSSRRLPSKSVSTAERDRMAKEVVEAILAKYPPGAGG